MKPGLVSVVVPVYNEEAVLGLLFDRLYPALDKLGVSYEILFINDGSPDSAWATSSCRSAVSALVPWTTCTAS